MRPSSSGYWTTLAATTSRPIRQIRAGGRPRRIFCSDRFAILINTRAAVRNWRVLACAVMRRYIERKGEDSGAGKRRNRACFAGMLGSIGRHRPGFNRPNGFGEGIMAPYTNLSPVDFRLDGRGRGHVAQQFRINIQAARRRDAR
jgi:hypothetical protein